MKKLLLLIALLPALPALAQIPSLTDNSVLRFREGNTIFDRPLSDLRTLLLPTGTDKYTIRYNGTDWVASVLLQNDGTSIGIGQAPSASYMLAVKQTGASTSTNGIAVERSGSTSKALMYHDGSATFASTGGNNLKMMTESGSLLLLQPGGGGGQASQVLISPGATITSALGNAAVLNMTGTYGPTTSGGDFSLFRLGTALNLTGAAAQPVDGLRIVPTLTAVPAGFYGIRYVPTTQNFLWQPQGADVKNRLAGDLSVGTDTTMNAAKVQIQGDGATSGTYSLIATNSGAVTSTAALAVRDDNLVGIGTNAPSYKLDINATTGIRIPAGTTAQRPTGAQGVLRFNDDLDVLEYHDGTDWQSAAGGGGVTDHGALTGLSDDDHTQYVLLAGRAAGQVLTGGTASGDDLTLRSTTNATKGDIIVADQGGNVVVGGGGTASQIQLLEPAISGTNKTTISAQAQAADINYTLPAANVVGDLRNDGSGGLSWGPTVITPAQITVTANDYAPTGWSTATLVRVSGDSDFEKITGLSAGAGGEVKTLTNVGSYCLYLAPEHTGSSAANRITHQEEVILWPGSSCQLLYDATSSRWRVLTTPSQGYQVPRRAKYFYEPISRASTAASADNVTDMFGSITMSEADASSTELFNSWAMTTGSTTSGGAGMYMPHDHAGAYVSGSHIIIKTLVKMPATLGDATNNYYYFVRIADSPSSGFFDQNSSVGIYYRYSDNSGKFWLRSRSSLSANTEVDSGVTVAVNTTYELQVSLNKANNEATFWINGDVVGRITTNLPGATNVGWSAQLEKTAGSSSRTCHTFYLIGAAIAP